MLRIGMPERLMSVPSNNNKKKTVRPVKRAASKAPPAVSQRVADLAWTGQHGTAIELAASSLAKSDLTIPERIDLLDLRAESHIAQGDFDAADADATAMLELARRARKPALLAQALNRRAIVEIRNGNSRDGAVTAADAVKAAHEARQPGLESTGTLSPCRSAIPPSAE